MDTMRFNPSHQCLATLLIDMRARQKAISRLLIYIHAKSQYDKNQLDDFFNNAIMEEHNETLDFIFEKFGLVDINQEDAKTASDFEEDKKI